MKEWLGLKLAPNSSYTPAFVEQLVQHVSRRGEVLGGTWYHFHVHQIYDAIEELEHGLKHPDGRVRKLLSPKTKPHSKLGGTLEGLWHKHFNSPAFLFQNLKDELEKHGEQLVHQTYPKRLREVGLTEAQDRQLGCPVLIQTLAMGPIENRARRAARIYSDGFTGEWIIYAQVDDKRVFLTLATHKENAADILSRIKPSLAAFPDLRKVPCLAAV